MINDLLILFSDPHVWAALATLIVMEVVLGIDNLIFISILTNKLPEKQRQKAQRIGISLALGLRLVLLASIAWIIHLTDPLFSVFGKDVSWRDLILIAGGLFLVWKATKEIHQSVDPDPDSDLSVTKEVALGFGAAIVQILMLDVVFSIDSIITAVGMTEHVPVMVVAVVVAVAAMMFSAGPLGRFLHANPTIVMLALGFLLMIGMTLIAEGSGFHVPKGYIYAAMAFSALVEGLNIFARRAKQKRRAANSPSGKTYS